MRRLAFAALVLFCACDRQHRDYQPLAPHAQPAQDIALSDLRPGLAPPTPTPPNAYDKNAWAIADGQRLFSWFNCVGCHSHGGGGMGPALMDAKWIYGSDPSNIYATIVEGRPNGMPSFRGKIGEQDVWKLVAYVRSLSAQVPMDVIPSRSDEMQVKPAIPTKEAPHGEKAEHAE